MSDVNLVCRDCGCDFSFTEAEQEYFRTQRFDSPKRCRACRAKNRQVHQRGKPPERGDRSVSVRRAAGPAPVASGMPENLVAFDSGPAAAQGDVAPPPRRRHDGPMHDTVCSVCGDPTAVPFVPDGVRPVYCLPCLKKQTR